MKKKSWGLVTLLILSCPFVAHATLIGDTVELTRLNCQPCSAVVVAGGNPEFNTPASDFTVEIEASSITLAAPQGRRDFGFGSLLMLSSLDWLGDPTGEIIGLTFINNGVTQSQGIPGNSISSTDFSFTDHSVTFDPSGTSWSGGDSVIINLQTAHTPVPEPTTLLLMGSGLAGLIGWQHRKKRNA